MRHQVWKVFQYKISVEFPWSIWTLDTMKFVMIMKTTTGSSWLMGLMPLKSLSVKVIGGRLHCRGVLTKLMLMSRMTCR